MVVVGLTLEYGVRAILYNADMPRDLGIMKPFSEIPTCKTREISIFGKMAKS